MSLTLQRLDAVLLHHDAELQHELGRALQEGLQQPQHADVRALEHHPPVEVAAAVLSLPPALQPQVQRAEVPAQGWVGG